MYLENKYNIKDLIYKPSNFPLNINNIFKKYDQLLEDNSIYHELPFMIFLDSKDTMSMIQIRSILNDLKHRNMTPIVIDFSILYKPNLTMSRTALRSSISIRMEQYGISYIPYIVHIPLNNARVTRFHDIGVPGIIIDAVRESIRDSMDSDEGRMTPPGITVDELTVLSDVDTMSDCRSMKIACMEMEEMVRCSKKELSNTIINSIVPPTVKGISLLMLRWVHDKRPDRNNFEGLKVVVIESKERRTTSKLAIKTLLSLNSTVSQYNLYTNFERSEFFSADVVISYAGIPNFIDKDWLRPDNRMPRLLVDVGYNILNDKVVGDFNTNCHSAPCYDFTPHIGGVGMLTRMSLLSNAINGYSRYFAKYVIK